MWEFLFIPASLSGRGLLNWEMTRKTWLAELIDMKRESICES